MIIVKQSSIQIYSMNSPYAFEDEDVLRGFCVVYLIDSSVLTLIVFFCVTLH